MNTALQIMRKISFRGTAVQIIAAKDGYNYKWFKRDPDRWGRSTRGLNLHISMNSGLQLTWDEWDEIVALVAEMREEIENA